MTKNAGRKKRTRERAARDGIRYREAARLDRGSVATRHARSSAPETADEERIEELLEDEIDTWCSRQDGRSLGVLPGLHEDAVAPGGIEDPTIAGLTFNMGSIDMLMVEMDDDTVASIQGTFWATLRVGGLMPYITAYPAAEAGQVSISYEGPNEHYARVVEQGHARVEIEFMATVDTEDESVEDFEVVYAAREAGS